MSVSQVCHKFFSQSLNSIHQYRKNALLDMTVALTRGASLSLTSIGRYLPGPARVKHKIKRVDRHLNSDLMFSDIPSVYQQLVSRLTHSLSVCVIVVDWSGYPSSELSVLRASLLCDGRAIPLMSKVISSRYQNNSAVQNAFLDQMAVAIGKDKQVIIVTDAGFRSSWFHHIRSLGWDFVGRVRGSLYFQVVGNEEWQMARDIASSTTARYLGFGRLARNASRDCPGHFYTVHKRATGRKSRQHYPKTDRMYRKNAREPWLLFTSLMEYKPREIVKIYSRRMQIEQNFRDEKSERYGLGLRASKSRGEKRLSVLCLVAVLYSIIIWLTGYYLESKGINRWFQANSEKSRRVLSYLTLSENVIQQSPGLLSGMNPDRVYADMARTYRNIIMVY
ncbi:MULTISPECIES: IS4 family transposase [Klebsiella]|uniref:IS4 family transposase n=1 Tax=Klebsiella TaxID=570 RepID=UPI0007CC0141|nr:MULTISPECIES: IS4 family transposase [Klebsiella]MBZ6728772.1 IS4 family transposase [Klebsiella grimontii]MBZ7381538.1 IS4 family transposase [Klebsiella grimontii]SBM15396.1 IS10 transposase [Klebsiella oxytoca]